MRAVLLIVPIALLLLAGPTNATKSAAHEAAALGARHVANGDADGAVATVFWILVFGVDEQEWRSAAVEPDRTPSSSSAELRPA